MSTNGTAGPAISFSGLGSGIDTASIVTQLMKLERAPIDRIEADKKTLNGKKGVVQETNSLLGKLRDAAAAMYKPDALQAKTASAADASVVTPSAGNAAAAGTYNVVVTSLAQAHTMASGAAPALTAGQSLGITVGGATVNVAVEAGDDLQTFADRINGTQDAGEDGISGIGVSISPSSGSSIELVTDGAGKYQASGLAVGSYGTSSPSPTPTTSAPTPTPTPRSPSRTRATRSATASASSTPPARAAAAEVTLRRLKSTTTSTPRKMGRTATSRSSSATRSPIPT